MDELSTHHKTFWPVYAIIKLQTGAVGMLPTGIIGYLVSNSYLVAAALIAFGYLLGMAAFTWSITESYTDDGPRWFRIMLFCGGILIGALVKLLVIWLFP